MEHETKTNSFTDRSQKKKILSHNNKHRQVTSKVADAYKKKRNLTTCHSKINPSTSFTAIKVLSKLNYTHSSHFESNCLNRNCLENSNVVPGDFIDSICFNTISHKMNKQNIFSEIGITSDNMEMDSKENTYKKEILSSGSENSNEENILKYKNLRQFEKCEDGGNVICRFCQCIICFDIIKLTEHANNCKTFIETKLCNINKFCCWVCSKVMKSLKNWKLHAVETYHINKCMNTNDYFSYACGGCKTLFFGNKDQVLKHCKDYHNDRSGLPSIFKCMKEILTEFIFMSPGNWTTWTFCGPCKKYSSVKMNCNFSNHLNKKFKHFHCSSCLINFICSQDVFNKHLLSSEHIMLEYLRGQVDENSESQIAHKLKLPPVFLNKFTINKKVAVCNDCEFQMFSNEKSITLHLTECIYKSDISGKNTTKINKYFCEVCSENISDFGQWKLHLILSSHLIKCYDRKNLVSYTCELCLLHCYGNAHHVAEHQDIHPNSSEKSLSMFMASNFQRINKDLKSKQFYYCEDCQTYAEVNLNSNHWNKSHKTKLKRMVCQPCRTEFFCIEGNDLFVKHIISSEHIILKYVTTKNPHFDLISSPVANSKKFNVLNDENQTFCGTTSTVNSVKIQNELSFESFSNWFKNVENTNKALCLSCNDQFDIDETTINHTLVGHLLNCNQNSSKNISMTNITSFQCLECEFYCKSYDDWEKHALLHLKLNTCSLYSYFHPNCSLLLYGKINEIESYVKNDHKVLIDDLPLETIVVAKQLMRRNNNVSKPPGTMCFCEPCKKIFKVIENCNHFNTDSHALVASDLAELFYCKYCEIEFYSSSSVYECHKLTVEHIIMRSEYSKTENISLLKPLKLDVHLFKFIMNQNLYDATLNIGFFCFICNYLCLSLDAWKNHINSKKHNYSSKGICMDHRCKICKTLMFGHRKHMFEHYRNPFHSMLRNFKLVNTNEVYKKKFDETNQKYIETTSVDSKNAENSENDLGESTSKMSETHTITKMVDESLIESNSQLETIILEKTSNCVNEPHSMATCKINETHTLTKIKDNSFLDINIQQENNILGETSTPINETHSTTITEHKSLHESITQLDGSSDESINCKNKTHLLTKIMDTFSLELNTQNYCNFYVLKIKMLNELINQNKDIKSKLSFYCETCDFITDIRINWVEHNLTLHSDENKIRRTKFCDVCQLYQVGPSDSLSKHFNTIEHKNMLDFQKMYNTSNVKKINDNTEEKNNNKNNLNTDKPSSVIKIDSQEKSNEREASNRKIIIEIKDAKPKYKRNSWMEIKKIFSTYGYFGIYPKHNSVIIIFRKQCSVHKMLRDKEKLEKLHEFIINVSFEVEKLPELNKTTEFEFGNKEVLIKTIDAQLMAINQEISNPNILHRLQLLISAIHRYAGPHFLCSKTYAFGSRMSGLALKDSDVDLYFDIGNTFGGELCYDLCAQEDLVRYFGKIFRNNNEFKQVQLITGARVPIVKFLHVPSSLYCDLSFKSGLSTHNTKLVRLYLTLNERVHWVVCAVVKRWALQNDLKNQGMFTSYALAWMVLFYLMTIGVVPPLKFLRDNAQYSEDKSSSDVIFIEDWDCTFCTLDKAKEIWKVPDISRWELLFGFFKFYSDSNRLKQFVLCPAIGEAIPKEKFVNVPMTSPDVLGFYKKKTGDAVQWSVKLRDNFLNEGLSVQDPFDLFHNITKIIVPRKLQGFSHLCYKTLEVMTNGTQPYYA